MNITAGYLRDLGPQLTGRDHEIIRTIGRFKLATGEQLERLYFADCSDTSRARNRQAVLARLAGHKVLKQVGHEHKETGQRRSMGGVGGGSRGYVFTLDIAGQHLAETTGNRPRRPLVWYEPAMAHFLAVTELYVRLVEADRAGRLKLHAYEAEPYCWRTFASQTLKPDAFAQVDVSRDGRRQRGSFFIEVDRANQYGTKISTKLPQYLSYWGHERALAASGEVRPPFPRIVFLAPTSQRVAYLRRLIQADPQHTELFRAELFDEAVMALAG